MTERLLELCDIVERLSKLCSELIDELAQYKCIEAEEQRLHEINELQL